MEISEISIRNFKGIEEVVLGSIKPINVLIGRNNSGKSSVLKCIQILNEFFVSLNANRTTDNNNNPTIKVKEDCFKSLSNNKGVFEISITAKQTDREIKEQINQMVEVWNKKYTEPKLNTNKAKAQIDRGLCTTLTFEFRGISNQNIFGLTSIKASDKENSNREIFVLSVNNNPGAQLRSVPLRHIFENQYNYNNLSELVSKADFNQGIKITRGNTISSAESSESAIQLINPAFRYIGNFFGSAFLVSPYRHGFATIQPQRANILQPDGANIVNYLHDLNLNNYRTFQEIKDFVKKIIPDVGRLHPRFVNDNSPELELAYEWSDGRVVNLANMGGGVEQLLILGSILLQQKSSCILWEEPESHLHPGAQDILLNELEANIGGSIVFITTHSPVFVRRHKKIAIHIITNKDGKSGIGRTLSEEELQEAAIILGSRPGHLAQADIVVYVEGKSGAAVFEEWLEKWPDRDKVLGHLLLIIQSCNADEIGTNDFDLKKLKKITPNMLFFVDKDNDEGSNEPKTARKKLLELSQQLDVQCIITNKRQIEDYFTVESVKSSLPSNLLKNWNHDKNKSIGEQFPSGWKKYNAKIASLMKWEDITKYDDIMQIFKEIEVFAKKLKPEEN